MEFYFLTSLMIKISSKIVTMVRSKVVHFDYKAMLDIKFSNVYHSLSHI